MWTRGSSCAPNMNMQRKLWLLFTMCLGIKLLLLFIDALHRVERIAGIDDYNGISLSFLSLRLSHTLTLSIAQPQVVAMHESGKQIVIFALFLWLIYVYRSKINVLDILCINYNGFAAFNPKKIRSKFCGFNGKCFSGVAGPLHFHTRRSENWSQFIFILLLLRHLRRERNVRHIATRCRTEIVIQ